MPQLVLMQLLVVLLQLNLVCMSQLPKLSKTKSKMTLSKSAFIDLGSTDLNVLSDTEYVREQQKAHQSLRVFMSPERFSKTLFQPPQNTLQLSINNENPETINETNLGKNKGSLYFKTLSPVLKDETEYPNNEQNYINSPSNAKQSEKNKYLILPGKTFQTKKVSGLRSGWNLKFLQKLDTQPYGVKLMLNKKPNTEAEIKAVLESLSHYPNNQGSVYLQKIVNFISPDSNLQKKSSQTKNNYFVLRKTRSHEKSLHDWIKFQSSDLSKLHGDPFVNNEPKIERCGQARRKDEDNNTICYTYPSNIYYYYYPYYYYPAYYYPYYYPYYYWG